MKYKMFKNRTQFLKIWWLNFEHKNMLYHNQFEVGRLGFYDFIADQIVEDTNER